MITKMMMQWTRHAFGTPITVKFGGSAMLASCTAALYLVLLLCGIPTAQAQTAVLTTYNTKGCSGAPAFSGLVNQGQCLPGVASAMRVWCTTTTTFRSDIFTNVGCTGIPLSNLTHFLGSACTTSSWSTFSFRVDCTAGTYYC